MKSEDRISPSRRWRPGGLSLGGPGSTATTPVPAETCVNLTGCCDNSNTYEGS